MLVGEWVGGRGRGVGGRKGVAESASSDERARPDQVGLRRRGGAEVGQGRWDRERRVVVVVVVVIEDDDDG